MRQTRRPRTQVAAVAFGQRVPGGDVPLPLVEGLDVRRRRRVVRVQQRQRRALGRPHRVVVDELAVGGTQRVHLVPDRRRRRRVGRGVGDPDVERVQEPPARRRVRRGLDARVQRECVQRVHQQRAGVLLPGRPREQRGEVGVVAAAPRARRAQRVQLRHPPPRRGRRRQRGRRHDERDVLPPAGQPVVADGQVGRQRRADLAHRAVLERHDARRRAASRSCPSSTTTVAGSASGSAPRTASSADASAAGVDASTSRACEDVDHHVAVELDLALRAVAVADRDAVAQWRAPRDRARRAPVDSLGQVGRGAQDVR